VTFQGLAHVRVLDLTSTLAGAYATKLLADAGAEVIAVEPPDGHPLRREREALWQYFHTSKRSVRSSVPDAELADLVAGADVVFESGSVDVEGLRAQHPQLVVVSVTPWGRTGPWTDRPATHFVVEGAAGSLLARGWPEDVPYQAGGHIGDYTMASFAAAAACPAVRHAQRTGQGAHVDCSLIETMAVAGSVFTDMLHALLGRPDLPTPPRSVETPSIERAADGWIGFNTNTGLMQQNFLLLIERYDLMDDPNWGQLRYRIEHRAEWQAMIDAWMSEHTIAEILERATELRIACAPVHDGETVLRNEQLVARGAFVENPTGHFLQPRPPWLVDGEVARPFEPAPTLGEADGALTGRIRPEPTDPARAGRLPLEGMRVLDLTSWWAGPSGTAVLAALGAEVIHVESTTHPDGMRATGYMFGKEDWWEWGHMFVCVNTSKLDVTLDLNDERGLALTKRLIQQCDLVVENFAPRVADRWGLTWEAIHELNPKAVYVRMPAFGLSGPWRDRPGFAQTMEQMSTIAWVTGPLGGPPRIVRGPSDPFAGTHSVVAMFAALAEAERTGQGSLVESTMVEASLNCAAENIIAFTAAGERVTRQGNRSPDCAPQGLYACQRAEGEPEQWLALSIATDDQWFALRKALGEPAWAGDARFDTAAGRHAHHDELDGHLGAWAASQRAGEAADRLTEAGVPAVEPWSPRILSDQPQLVARGLFEHVPHPVVGTHPVPVLPFRWSGIDHYARSHAPLFGEHNHDVLSRLCGLTDDEIAELEAAGVIGTRPV